MVDVKEKRKGKTYNVFDAGDERRKQREQKNNKHK
jgi:hypothetical protein